LLVKNGLPAVFDQQIQEFLGFGTNCAAETAPKIIELWPHPGTR